MWMAFSFAVGLGEDDGRCFPLPVFVGFLDQKTDKDNKSVGVDAPIGRGQCPPSPQDPGLGGRRLLMLSDTGQDWAYACLGLDGRGGVKGEGEPKSG